MTPPLSERLVTIANRLGASFHAAVRAARNEWRLGSDDAKAFRAILDRLSGLTFGGPLIPGVCEFCGAECRTHCDDCDRKIVGDDPDPRYAEHDEHCTCTKCRGLEGTRPAPSSTKCKDCKGPWRPGHLCSEGTAKK